MSSALEEYLRQIGLSTDMLTSSNTVTNDTSTIASRQGHGNDYGTRSRVQNHQNSIGTVAGKKHIQNGTAKKGERGSSADVDLKPLSQGAALRGTQSSNRSTLASRTSDANHGTLPSTTLPSTVPDNSGGQPVSLRKPIRPLPVKVSASKAERQSPLNRRDSNSSGLSSDGLQRVDSTVTPPPPLPPPLPSSFQAMPAQPLIPAPPPPQPPPPAWPVKSSQSLPKVIPPPTMARPLLPLSPALPSKSLSLVQPPSTPPQPMLPLAFPVQSLPKVTPPPTLARPLPSSSPALPSKSSNPAQLPSPPAWPVKSSQSLPKVIPPPTMARPLPLLSPALPSKSLSSVQPPSTPPPPPLSPACPAQSLPKVTPPPTLARPLPSSPALPPKSPALPPPPPLAVQSSQSLPPPKFQWPLPPASPALLPKLSSPALPQPPPLLVQSAQSLPKVLPPSPVMPPKWLSAEQPPQPPLPPALPMEQLQSLPKALPSSKLLAPQPLTVAMPPPLSTSQPPSPIPPPLPERIATLPQRMPMPTVSTSPQRSMFDPSSTDYNSVSQRSTGDGEVVNASEDRTGIRKGANQADENANRSPTPLTSQLTQMGNREQPINNYAFVGEGRKSSDVGIQTVPTQDPTILADEVDIRHTSSSSLPNTANSLRDESTIQRKVSSDIGSVLNHRVVRQVEHSSTNYLNSTHHEPLEQATSQQPANNVTSPPSSAAQMISNGGYYLTANLLTQSTGSYHISGNKQTSDIRSSSSSELEENTSLGTTITDVPLPDQPAAMQQVDTLFYQVSSVSNISNEDQRFPQQVATFSSLSANHQVTNQSAGGMATIIRCSTGPASSKMNKSASSDVDAGITQWSTQMPAVSAAIDPPHFITPAANFVSVIRIGGSATTSYADNNYNTLQNHGRTTAPQYNSLTLQPPSGRQHAVEWSQPPRPDGVIFQSASVQQFNNGGRYDAEQNGVGNWPGNQAAAADYRAGGARFAGSQQHPEQLVNTNDRFFFSQLSPQRIDTSNHHQPVTGRSATVFVVNSTSTSSDESSNTRTSVPQNRGFTTQNNDAFKTVSFSTSSNNEEYDRRGFWPRDDVFNEVTDSAGGSSANGYVSVQQQERQAQWSSTGLRRPPAGVGDYQGHGAPRVGVYQDGGKIPARTTVTITAKTFETGEVGRLGSTPINDASGSTPATRGVGPLGLTLGNPSQNRSTSNGNRNEIIVAAEVTNDGRKSHADDVIAANNRVLLNGVRPERTAHSNGFTEIDDSLVGSLYEESVTYADNVRQAAVNSSSKNSKQRRSKDCKIS